MNIAVLIPARAGSKRIPLKNFKLLGNKPLLFWSIDVALATNCFTKIAVSSDSDENLRLVQRNYDLSAVDMIKRPGELATDHADLMDVCRDFLTKNKKIEYLCLMMPTYPFRDFKKLRDQILPSLYSRQIDRIISVRPESFSTFDYWTDGDGGYRRMFDHAPLWCSAGNAAYFIMKREYYFTDPHKWPCSLGERTLKVETDELEALDIDTPQDFEKAEKLVAGERIIKRTVVFHEDITHEYALPEGVQLDGFKKFLKERGISFELPILIFVDPPPYFTFLRIQECSFGKNYYTEETLKMIAAIPKSGHSQDFPPHFIHSQHYRVLRKGRDDKGIYESFVPSGQVVFMKDLEQWEGYVAPSYWG